MISSAIHGWSARRLPTAPTAVRNAENERQTSPPPQNRVLPTGIALGIVSPSAFRATSKQRYRLFFYFRPRFSIHTVTVRMRFTQITVGSVECSSGGVRGCAWNSLTLLSGSACGAETRLCVKSRRTSLPGRGVHLKPQQEGGGSGPLPDMQHHPGGGSGPLRIPKTGNPASRVRRRRDSPPCAWPVRADIDTRQKFKTNARKGANDSGQPYRSSPPPATPVTSRGLKSDISITLLC